MAKFWNSVSFQPMLKTVCAFLNGLYEDISFYPEQVLKSEDFLAVSATGSFKKEIEYVDGELEWKTEIEISCHSAGDEPESRFQTLALLEEMIRRALACSSLVLPGRCSFRRFEVSELPRLFLRESNGDDLFACKLYLCCSWKGADG